MLGLSLLFSHVSVFGEDSGLEAELKDFVTQVDSRVTAGKRTEADYADLLKRADDMLAKHQAEKSDTVTHILVLKAAIYMQILHEPDKAIEAFQKLKTDFPDSPEAGRVDAIVANIKQQQASDKVQSGLAAGKPFPDFNEKDIAGNPVSLAAHKGKVVLVDFWATWCGPCRGEFPNVKKTYELYHAKGFDIIGVSLDQDRSKLDAFIKDNGVTWQQFFDGQGWGNKLATTYGVQSIPATFLIDTNGVIIDRDLRGEELQAAVAKAVAGR